jgi:hypothetical protein
VQVCDQLGDAMAAAKGTVRRVLKLGKLMLAMEARNQIADGLPRSKVREHLRNRRPERRSHRKTRRGSRGNRWAGRHAKKC